MSARILGVDPGLTRCGVGVIDVLPGQRARLVDVGVIRTPADMRLEERVRRIGDALDELLDHHNPTAIALERVFAQQNLKSVMGTAQVSGVVLLAAGRRALSVGLHTPSEVKAAVTGYGAADKRQVGEMVARILELPAPPTPADAADALALALCHAWRGGADAHTPSNTATPAQALWRAAEARR